MRLINIEPAALNHAEGRPPAGIQASEGILARKGSGLGSTVEFTVFLLSLCPPCSRLLFILLPPFFPLSLFPFLLLPSCLSEQVKLIDRAYPGWSSVRIRFNHGSRAALPQFPVAIFLLPSLLDVAFNPGYIVRVQLRLSSIRCFNAGISGISN